MAGCAASGIDDGEERTGPVRKCPMCGAKKLEAATCEATQRVDGLTFTATVPCQRCGACGEELVGGDGLERFDLTVAVELVRSGRRTGAALRFMRKCLGYKSGDLAALLDVAPETFSRWETGEREPDARAFALVGFLAAARLRGEDEDALALLRAMRDPREQGPGPVKVALAS